MCCSPTHSPPCKKLVNCKLDYWNTTWPKEVEVQIFRGSEHERPSGSWEVSRSFRPASCFPSLHRAPTVLWTSVKHSTREYSFLQTKLAVLSEERVMMKHIQMLTDLGLYCKAHLCHQHLFMTGNGVITNRNVTDIETLRLIYRRSVATSLNAWSNRVKVSD